MPGSTSRVAALGLLVLCSFAIAETVPIISGAQWQPITIDFEGPPMTASGVEPNPFLDYRLQVTFTAPSGAKVAVPGYFDGDGNGGYEGNVWRVMFSADEAGEWKYTASFREGPAIAINLDPNAGQPAAFDGASGTLGIGEASSSGLGFYQFGRLDYVGEHYLRFRNGSYWLKGGTDSPEDLLAYTGFSNTPRATHRYEAHASDWKPGDPDWNDGAGKGIIGALNYLNSVAVNSIYFLPMNIGGDGKNVWPFLGNIDGGGSDANDNLHYDLAKLRQWGMMFDHAQRHGIMLHFVLNEAEERNKRELDDGALGTERQLYYRELIARFAHFPALQWNLCEEYNLNYELDPELVKQFAQYIYDVDPYDHPVTVHHAGRVEKAWAPFLGDKRFPVTSFQTRDLEVVESWRMKSEEAGFPQVIGMDEFFPDKAHADNADRHRREYLWPIYMSGGQLEFILDELLKTEDFRKYEPHWRDMAHARAFMEGLPFWEMQPNDALVAGAAEFQGEHNTIHAQVFAKPNELYAIYLPIAEPSATVDLREATGQFTQRWFNPRSGSFEGDARAVEGGSNVTLGGPPMDPEKDWAVLVTRP